MSKKITHEQAREGLLQVYVYNDIHTNEANYVLIRDYITQQEELEKEYNACVEHLHLVDLHSDNKDFLLEKQQKLLELYKEHYELKKLEDSTEMIIECLFKTEKCENYHKRIKEIESEIKELENE